MGRRWFVERRGRALAAVALVGVVVAAGIRIGTRPAAEETAADAESIRLVVDLSERRLHVVEGGETTRSYTVAVGQPEHPTPKGTFRVRRIIWNPRWVPPNAAWARGKKARAPGDPDNPMGRAKIFFREPDYYIHGTAETGSLGTAASHGCIRMSNGDVLELARLLMEHGGEPKPPGWFQRLRERITETREARLGRPVRLTIRA